MTPGTYCVAPDQTLAPHLNGWNFRLREAVGMLSSRERVLRSLSHREPDRVPIAFGTMHTSSIHLEPYRRLVRYVGLTDATEQIGDSVQQVVHPDERLRDQFGNDVKSVSPMPARPWSRPHGLPGDRWIDEWGIVFYRVPGGHWYEFDSAHTPLREGSIEELDRYDWPDPGDAERLNGLHEAVRQVRHGSDKAIILLGTAGGLFEQSAFLRGMEDLFMDMVLQPRYVEILAEKLLEWQIRFWTQVLCLVGRDVDIVGLADDLGHQGGLLFSPKIYRKIYRPRHQRLIAHICGLTDAKIWLHSCGAIREIIPDLIDIGVEILDPVQVSAVGMDGADLKREFGKDLVFWGGGVNTQSTLPFGSPEEVRREVRKRLVGLAPGGGYVFTPGHNIQPGVPPENIVALYEAALEYGVY